MKHAIPLLAMMTLIAGCGTFAGNRALEAACVSWWDTIPVTIKTDRRALREQELLARETQQEVCE